MIFQRPISGAFFQHKLKKSLRKTGKIKDKLLWTSTSEDSGEIVRVESALTLYQHIKDVQQIWGVGMPFKGKHLDKDS
jgi:hypothetical protein